MVTDIGTWIVMGYSVGRVKRGPFLYFRLPIIHHQLPPFPGTRPLLLFVEGYLGPMSASTTTSFGPVLYTIAKTVGWRHCVTSTAPRHEWVNDSAVLGSPPMYCGYTGSRRIRSHGCVRKESEKLNTGWMKGNGYGKNTCSK